MQDWLWQSAADLGRGIGAGEICPKALCETYLEAISAHPDAGRIYSVVTADRARAEAAAAAERAEAGIRRGPLDGVPVSWKDLFDSAGVATEAGTRLMAGRVPARDAELLRRGTAAGLVCLGKTHMSEIAFSGLGLNPMTATPPNRFDAGAVPGGSSSGAAASVAFGLAAAAIGTDTGGSVRVPSAWNGLVGLKTTHGLLPLDGVVPLASGFDTAGPLCRSTEDAALLLEVLGGPATDLRGATPEGARLAVITTIGMEDLDPEVAGAFAAARGWLEAAGVAVSEMAAPELTEAFALAGPLYTADAWANWRALIGKTPEVMWYHIRERVSVGADVSAADYLDAQRELEALRAVWNDRIAGFDAVICPTVAIRAPQVAALLADDDHYRQSNLMALRNTRIGNLMGGCGVQLPTAEPGCGVLLNGAPGQEARLLRVAAAVEVGLGAREVER